MPEGLEGEWGILSMTEMKDFHWAGVTAHQSFAYQYKGSFRYTLKSRVVLPQRGLDCFNFT